MTNASFPAYVVEKSGDQATSSVRQITTADLPEGDVLIRVQYSSLNYKDALAATGHRGVVRRLPHVPGIDAAGEVVDGAGDWSAGQKVIVTGYELGAGSWGGWSQYIRVPAEWVVALPEGLTLRQAMLYGTAGFTAAQSVFALERHGIAPDDGDIVVTGATGGVGSLAVRLLAKLGYRVTAVTGKAEQRQWLGSIGAANVIGREEANDESDRPLLSERWAGAVDTVGGGMLSSILRSAGHRACVAACGMVGGVELPMTVYPFILRGVTLAGIDSAKCPYGRRLEIWSRLASSWKLDNLDENVAQRTLPEMEEQVRLMLAGKTAGRVLVTIP